MGQLCPAWFTAEARECKRFLGTPEESGLMCGWQRNIYGTVKVAVTDGESFSSRGVVYKTAAGRGRMARCGVQRKGVKFPASRLRDKREPLVPFRRVSFVRSHRGLRVCACYTQDRAHGDRTAPSRIRKVL